MRSRILFCLWFLFVFASSLKGQTPVSMVGSPGEGYVSVGAPAVFPRWAACGGYRSVITIQNLGDKPTSVEVHLWLENGQLANGLAVSISDDDGKRTLNADGGVVVLNVSSTATLSTLCVSPNIVAGSAALFSSTEKVAGILSFYYPRGSGVSSTTVDVAPWRRSHSIFVDYVKGNPFVQSTGIAVVNVDTVPANIRLTLYDQKKNKVGSVKTTILNPNQSFAKFIHETFNEIDDMDEFHGTVVVDSDYLTASMGARYVFDRDGQYTIDNFPSKPGPTSMNTIAQATRVLCFYPADRAEDDCMSSLSQMVKSAEVFWNNQMEKNNQGRIGDRVPFLYDTDTRSIHVDAFQGRLTTVEYQNLIDSDPNFLNPSNRFVNQVQNEIRDYFPGIKHFVVSYNYYFFKNAGGAWGYLGQSAWVSGVQPGLISPTQFSDPALISDQSTPYGIAAILAHEIGHSLGLESGRRDGAVHTLDMESQFNDKVNIMNGYMPQVSPFSRTPADFARGFAKEVYGFLYQDPRLSREAVVDGAEAVMLVRSNQ